MARSEPHYAGFWIRALAVVLDLIIIWLPTFLISFALTWVTGYETPYSIIVGTMSLFVIYLDGAYGGTPGKLICGIRIVNEKYELVGIPRAALRNIGQLYSFVILGIGFLMVAFDEKKQGLHDKIADTYVVYKNK